MRGDIGAGLRTAVGTLSVASVVRLDPALGRGGTELWVWTLVSTAGGQVAVVNG